VGNYSNELKHLRNRPRIHFTKGCHAWGVIEGIHYYDFFGSIRIPNDQIRPEPAETDDDANDGSED
ncbi:MAG TPA: hypothetical protein VLO11_08540, partial [Luteolibacter sp.]|nr:hypothetical protein [Luteolibacter sp.]